MILCTVVHYIQNLNIKQNGANENALHVLMDIKVLRMALKSIVNVTHKTHSSNLYDWVIHFKPNGIVIC